MPPLSVRQLTEQLKRTLEKSFTYIYVQGEVSGTSRPSSGHIYFSLKEGSAVLPVVWFAGAQRREERVNRLTGEVYEDGPRPSLSATLHDGQQVICGGQITLYAPQGKYQLRLDSIMECGLGDLYLAFEALKRKLDAKGYFLPEHKHPLPENPKRVVLITSPTGAAIRDFLKIARTRGTGAKICVHPVLVQGNEAPTQIAAAIRQENRRAWAQVIVLIRGGGGIEDLQAFNDEGIADAIFESSLPVLTGIGHEIDTSIADLVADLRTATPTHAAETLWEPRDNYVQFVDGLEERLRTAIRNILRDHEQKLHNLDLPLRAFSPLNRLVQIEERRNTLFQRLQNAMKNELRDHELTLAQKNANLRLQSPVHRMNTLLERVAHCTENLVSSQNAVLDRNGQTLFGTTDRLLGNFSLRLERIGHRLDKLQTLLAALNPEAPLDRGYALAFTGKGVLVRGTDGIRPGMDLTIRVHDGEIDTKVATVRSAVPATGK